MDLLQEARTIINQVDAQMAALFVQRMRAAEMVAQYKKIHALPILDKAREEAVIRRNAALVEDEALRELYIAFLQETMALSRQYQHRLLSDGSDPAELPVEIGYPIFLQRGILSKVDTYLNLKRKVLVVTDSGVPAQYAATVAECCANPVTVTLPQGETSKNLQNFELLCRTLLQHGFTRTDCVVAVGGGALIVVVIILLAGNQYTTALDNYIAVNFRGDASKIELLAPKEYWDYVEEEYDRTVEDMKDSLEENWDDVKDALEDQYGKNVKVTYKVTKEREISDKKLEKIAEALEETYGIDEKSVKAGYKIEAELTISGSEDDDDDEGTFNIIKIGNRWYMINYYESGDELKVYFNVDGMSIG